MTKEIIEFYEAISVYPQMSSIRKSKSILQASAPLAEDDKGKICFLSQREKDDWIKKLRKR